MATPTTTPPRRRVPAEHRVAGLDRRSFPYAIAVLAVFVLYTVVFPRINDAVAYDDPVKAGDQLALTDSITLTPATGWNVESGLRVGQGATSGSSEDAALTHNAVTLMATTGDFDGTPAQLLRQIKTVNRSTTNPTFRLDGTPTTLTSTSGEVGVVQPFSGLQGEGLVAAFVIDGTGVELIASGPTAQLRSAAADIDAMMLSVRTGEGSPS